MRHVLAQNPKCRILLQDGFPAQGKVPGHVKLVSSWKVQQQRQRQRQQKNKIKQNKIRRKNQTHFTQIPRRSHFSSSFSQATQTRFSTYIQLK